jgi:hypothetical protein
LSYDFEISAADPPELAALRAGIPVADVHGFPDDAAWSWADRVLSLHRDGISTRSTEISWQPGPEGGATGKLRVVVRALASREDCELALSVVEAAAGLAGASVVHADYFGDISLGELRRLHPAAWMDEQAESATRGLAHLIKEGRGPMEVPGPRRSCYIGTRLLGELSAAGPPESLPTRVLETLRGVQWRVPPDYRDAGVFVSGGDAQPGATQEKPRPVRFAVWLGDSNLIVPRVDYVALRAAEGEVVMVPFSAVAGLAGARGQLLDECQIMIRAAAESEWQETVARARPLEAGPRRA